jgi:hypothetical protein
MFLQIFDSFFYISLAITFGLILLMVFHFKNRIYTLEEKNKDLSELCHTMIKELEHIKLIQQYNFSNISTAQHTMLNNSDDDDDYDNEYKSDDSDEVQIPVFKKITVLDSILQSNSSDEYETETVEHEVYEESEELEEVEEYDLDNYSDIGDLPDLLPDTTVEDTSVEQLLKTIELDTLDVDSSILETIQVTKSSEENEIDINELDAKKPPMKKNPYVKMNIQMLRTSVISKGLCSDASKMKKPELIEILMNHDNEQHI